MIRRRGSLMDKEIIPTSTAQQASIIIENMFNTAEKSIRILTGGLNPRVYGTAGVIQEAANFLSNQCTTMEIIFINPISNNKIFSHRLINTIIHNSNFYIYRLKEDMKKDISFHFCVVDGKTYRFKSEPHKHFSIASFGDTELAQHLENVFLTVKENSTPINKERNNQNPEAA